MHQRYLSLYGNKPAFRTNLACLRLYRCQASGSGGPGSCYINRVRAYDSTLTVLYEGELFHGLEQSFYAACCGILRPETCIIGIRSGGDILAERLANYVRQNTEFDPPVGFVDISLYRDDFGHRKHWPSIQATDISFDLTDKHILLVDEVLFTGRTIRAALEALQDFGRARTVTLAILFDRGDRQLPIQPDIVGTHIPLSRDDSLLLEFNGVSGDRAFTIRNSGR